MAVFKCKMCGATLNIEQNQTTCECEYCGTSQTLPKLDDDKRANMYDRANHFRRSNDYDKAAGIYERILEEDNTDAEAYWSLVLCRYGIEYVEDPTTHKRIPTVNRTQYTSIFDDDDYKQALEHADTYQKSIYVTEAKAINTIQKGILEISQKEEPFDVFICYKETDNNGRRTQDSVLANELYHQLTQEGFKVFFSRITLEDKIGMAYEPYIFAALNSAKVMVVLGTKPEHFNAVWVKNEWSRFLSLVKQSGGKKVLIPAYRDMDPYELPEEFSHLQAQDMSKLGFMQDLIRGIKKIAKADEPKVTVKETVVSGSATSVDPLLKRAFMFLEDGEWNRADDFCEQVLNQEPENAQAYLGKLMAELHVRRQEDLLNCEQPFNNSNNYQKAIRFGEEKLSSELKAYIAHINERNENIRKAELYDKAVIAMEAANDEDSYRSTAALFKEISGFRDSDSLAEGCIEKADIYYEEAEIKKEEERLERERRLEEHRLTAERNALKARKAIKILVPIIVACIVVVILITKVIIPGRVRSKAESLMNAGNYKEAYALLLDIDDEKGMVECKYEWAVASYESEDYETAYALLMDMNYKDSAEMFKKAKEKYRRQLIVNATVGSNIMLGTYPQYYSKEDEDIEWTVLAKKGNSLLVISKDALDWQPYNETKESSKSRNVDFTWGTCSLNKWLNSAFLNKAFSSDELSLIQDSDIEGASYKLFLLSASEAQKYFKSDEERKTVATDYAVGQGGKNFTDDNYNHSCEWWLRDQIDHNDVGDFAGCVGFTGRVYDQKNEWYETQYVRNGSGVRPAMWINIESLQ